MKHPLTLALFLAVLGLAATASAALSDFALKDRITLADLPGRLAVTPDDRFVLVLQPAAKAIAVVDTWNFSPLGGSISLSASPVSITLTPRGDQAFVTLTSGKIAQVNLSSLAGLGLNGALSLTASYPTLAFADSIGDIATVPLGGSTIDSCVFVISGNTLEWFKASAPGTVAGLTPLDCKAREVEGGKKFAFLLCDNPVTQKADLRQYQCTSGGPLNVTITALALGDSVAVQGLSLAPSYDWLVAGDSLTKTITLIGADSVTPGTTVIAGSTSTQVLGMRDILATDFSSDSPVAFTVAGDTLILAQIAAPIDQFTGTYLSLTLPMAGGGFLGRSSSSDQYAYLSLAGGSTLSVVTANPWVTITGVHPGGTVLSGDTITVSFKSEPTYSYALKLASGFKTGTTLKTGSVSTDLAVGATVAVNKLNQGVNILELDVTVGTRTGRNAVAVNVNLAPIDQNFSLDFGTAKLIIQYTVQNRTNLDRQEIYYGDTLCSTNVNPLAGYTLIDNNTVDGGKPPSPIIISSPTAGQKVSKVVDGVKNGKTYCVQIVTFDTSSRFSLGVRKSIRVEKAFTLTQSAGEKGGFQCFSALAPELGFRDSGAWVVAVPWLAVWLVRIKRRWRRSW